MTTDTIAAIATAPGAGGIGIVRVSGPGALPILEKLFAPAGKGGYKPWILRRGRVQDTEGNTLDDSLAVFMPGPKTFTGEDVAEFQCHGGPVLLAAVLVDCLPAGAPPAGRGGVPRHRQRARGRRGAAAALPPPAPARAARPGRSRAGPLQRGKGISGRALRGGCGIKTVFSRRRECFLLYSVSFPHASHAHTRPHRPNRPIPMPVSRSGRVSMPRAASNRVWGSSSPVQSRNAPVPAA